MKKGCLSSHSTEPLAGR